MGNSTRTSATEAALWLVTAIERMAGNGTSVTRLTESTSPSEAMHIDGSSTQSSALRA